MQQAASSGQWAVKASMRDPDSRRSAAHADAQALPTAQCPLPTVLIIGHRGAAAVAPENTLVSFERALVDGADGIEFDVRLSRDGVPVVIHDATLRRTTLTKGMVSKSRAAQLCQMDAGTWFNIRNRSKARVEYLTARIPALVDVFEMMKARDAEVYLEMKCGRRDRSALAAEVAKLIRKHSFVERVIVESFDLAAIAEIKRLDNNFRTAALFDRRLSRPAPSARKMIERASACRAEQIALHHSLATRRTLKDAAQQGLETVVWTVDNPAWVERAIRDNVRALITNNPARLCAQRDQWLGGR